jgi:hypothetical protein
MSRHEDVLSIHLLLLFQNWVVLWGYVFFHRAIYGGVDTE